MLGLGRMMADALDQNGAAKVYILGRRLEKLQEVAKEAVSNSLAIQLSPQNKLSHGLRKTALLYQFKWM